MVMTYALPLAIFVGTVSLTRRVLMSELPLLIALAVAIIGLYGVVFLVCRFVLRFPLGLSLLCALAASSPDVPYVGPVVINYLYGSVGNIPVAIGSLLINVTVVPLTVILLTLSCSEGADQAAQADVLPRIVEGVKEPVVWLPLLGFAFVLLGVQVPELIASSLAVLGHSAAGVALFAVGIILAGYRVTINRFVLGLVSVKNIVQPALVWVGLLALGYTAPLLGEAVITAAIPMITLIAILGVRYRLAETEAASAVFLSFVSSLVTIGLFIAVTGGQSFHADINLNSRR